MSFGSMSVTGNLDINEVKRVIHEAKGGMFVVDFIKADGSLRKMYCKCGITRPSKRGASKTKKRTYTVTAKRELLVNVWDCQAKAFRSFKPETVVRISNRYEVLENKFKVGIEYV